MTLANRTAARLLIGLAACLAAQAGTAAPGRVDAESIAANGKDSRDWPTYGLDYAETRFSRLKQVNAGNVARLGLVWTYDLESKRGVEATPLVVGRCHVCHCFVERRACNRRPYGPPAVDLRPTGAAFDRLQGLLRCGQPRRGALRRQGICRLIRRTADRARCRHRQGRVAAGHGHRPREAVHGHRRTARVQGQRRDRQRRRRVRRTRLRIGLRRGNRRAALALVHGARGPGRPYEDARSHARRRPGTRPASTGNLAAAAPCGTRWRTTPIST